MNNRNITTILDKAFVWITKLAFLNFLWIVFTLIGLGAFGIFPATSAILGVVRKWLMGNQTVPIRATFIKIYKEEFKYANTIGWILTILGFILFLNYRNLQTAQGELLFVIPFVFYLILFLYLTIVIWAFPLVVHNYASIIHQLKNALIIGISKIHITITIMLLLFSIMYFSLEFPVLLLFFSFSLLALVWMWLTLRVFKGVF
ncbi:YesL family protein [Gracilibacillus xinjiangensis]|uniref:YesL family protein n=1 Tax=Gracilibacillus xinjiangensis TaxID=1193282 RepID=A0ABV8WS99_9BACI